MKQILYWLVVLIAGFAIYGTFGLVLKEWNIGNICPKILGFPACYIVMICFIIGLVSHLIPGVKTTWIYYLFIGLVTIIAITGTVGELIGLTKCPRTAGGTPMCFISLAICLTLILVKTLLIRMESAPDLPIN